MPNDNQNDDISTGCLKKTFCKGFLEKYGPIMKITFNLLSIILLKLRSSGSPVNLINSNDNIHFYSNILI